MHINKKYIRFSFRGSCLGLLSHSKMAEIVQSHCSTAIQKYSLLIDGRVPRIKVTS